jgi:hypothetical protein
MAEEQIPFAPRLLEAKLKTDYDYYMVVVGLCMLTTMGASDEIKLSAGINLENFINPDARAIHRSHNSLRQIYLTNSANTSEQYIVSVPVHYRSFMDNMGIVYIVSTN